MRQERDALMSKTIADAIEEWFDEKGISQEKVEYRRQRATWDGQDDYVVVEEICFRPSTRGAVSAEVWVTEGAAIALGFRIASDDSEKVLWGFEPIFVDIAVVLKLLELAATGSFRISSIPLLKRFSVGNRLVARRSVCDLVSGLAPGVSLPKLHAEETEGRYRQIAQAPAWT